MLRTSHRHQGLRISIFYLVSVMELRTQRHRGCKRLKSKGALPVFISPRCGCSNLTLYSVLAAIEVSCSGVKSVASRRLRVATRRVTQDKLLKAGQLIDGSSVLCKCPRRQSLFCHGLGSTYVYLNQQLTLSSRTYGLVDTLLTAQKFDQSQA